MSFLPEPTEGARRVLVYFFLLFGILNIVFPPVNDHTYHRYPWGRTAGIFYVIGSVGYLIYSYTRKSKDEP